MYITWVQCHDISYILNYVSEMVGKNSFFIIDIFYGNAEINSGRISFPKICLQLKAQYIIKELVIILSFLHWNAPVGELTINLLSPRDRLSVTKPAASILCTTWRMYGGFFLDSEVKSGWPRMISISPLDSAPAVDQRSRVHMYSYMKTGLDTFEKAFCLLSSEVWEDDFRSCGY